MPGLGQKGCLGSEGQTRAPERAYTLRLFFSFLSFLLKAAYLLVRKTMKNLKIQQRALPVSLEHRCFLATGTGIIVLCCGSLYHPPHTGAIALI